MRGFSILWVLAYHLIPYDLFRKGTFGVLLFFIISGYCISLSASTATSAWHFYAKRMGRIFPALVICGFLTTALKAAVPHVVDKPTSWFDYAYVLFALPTLNFLRVDYMLPDGAYWSLQTEFFFYFIYACLMAAGVRRQMLYCLCAVAVYRTLITSLADVSIDYLPFFIAGVAVATATEGRVREALIGIAIAFALDAYQLRFHMKQPSIPVELSRSVLLWVGTAVVWAAASYDLPDRLRRAAKPLAWVGLISYPLYLIHQEAGIILVKLGLARWLAIAILILVAWLIFVFVEKPFIRPLTNFIAAPLRRRSPVQLQAAAANPLATPPQG